MSSDPIRLIITLDVLVDRIKSTNTRYGTVEGRNADSGSWEELIKVTLKTSKNTDHAERGLYRGRVLTVAEMDVKARVAVGSNAVTVTRESFMDSMDESPDLDLGVPHEKLTSAWVCLTDGIGSWFAEVQNS